MRDLHLFKGGDDLRLKIVEALERATTVLVIIGASWMQIDERTGRARIEEGDDWVRLEVSLALAWDKVVIPVLLNATRMPDRRTLPQDIAGLANKVAHPMRVSDWRSDVDRLSELISPGSSAQPPHATQSIVDAGPIAGGDITISGNTVAGRDLIVGSDDEDRTGRRRRRAP